MVKDCDKNKSPGKAKTSKEVNVSESDDKQKKLEEMQMRVKKLREERIAKHAARIEMLKKMNLEKYSEKSQGFNTSVNAHHSNVSLTFKPSSTPLHTTVANKLQLPTYIKHDSGDKSTIAKSPAMKCKYGTIQTKVDCRRSVAVNLVSKPQLHGSVSTATKPAFKNTLKPKTPLRVSFDTKNKSTFGSKSGVFPDNKTLQSSTINVKQKQLPKITHTLSSRNVIVDNKHASVAQKKISITNNQFSKPKVASKILEIHKQDKNNGFKHASQNVQLKDTGKKVESNRNKVSGRTIDVSKPKVEEKSDLKEKSHMRRSLSTVHFRRMGPEAVKKCMRRTFSVGNFKHGDLEDELAVIPFKEYTLPVKSERKKSVKFLTPLRKSNTPTLFLNTPKPSELKSRLNDWLHKRGKSLSSYHHLHCFGVHHSNVNNKNTRGQVQESEENKENQEVYNDDSFEELISGAVKDNAAEWRRASYSLVDSPVVSISSNPNITQDTAKSPTTTNQSTGVGALENLLQLILEGYCWQQCAEWLDAIVRHCSDKITNTPQYWECRAALEDKRGHFPMAVQCYNKAILQGAHPAQVEESLDHLLHKFMKLNLDPDKKAIQGPDPKFLDVKNVFKSTLIRFAIQQKNIAESKAVSGNLINKYVATPVRRSSRLSSHVPDSVKSDKTAGIVNDKTKEEPLTICKSASKSTGRKHLVQLCSTLQNVNGEIRNNLVFVPNKALNFNDL